MNEVAEQIMNVFESTMAGLCDKHEQGVGGTQFAVVQFPEGEQGLKPFASGLQKALRRELFSDTKYFFHKSKEFQTEDTAKWDEMADWLHKNADAYEDTLRRIIRGLA